MIDIYSNSYFYVITRSLWGLRRWHDEQGRIFVGHGISIICEWIWDGRKRPIQMTTNSWIASWVMHLNLTLIGPFGHSLGVTTLEREQLIWRGSMGYLILVGAMFEIQDFCRGSSQSNLPLKLWLETRNDIVRDEMFCGIKNKHRSKNSSKQGFKWLGGFFFPTSIFLLEGFSSKVLNFQKLIFLK